jgi:hypothetical protein
LDRYLVKTEKGILILTINRVDKKNTLCEDMCRVSANAFEQLGRDETIRCMLIKRVVFVKEIPISHIGNILCRDLRGRYKEEKRIAA